MRVAGGAISRVVPHVGPLVALVRRLQAGAGHDSVSVSGGVVRGDIPTTHDLHGLEDHDRSSAGSRRRRRVGRGVRGGLGRRRRRRGGVGLPPTDLEFVSDLELYVDSAAGSPLVALDRCRQVGPVELLHRVLEAGSVESLDGVVPEDLPARVRSARRRTATGTALTGRLRVVVAPRAAEAGREDGDEEDDQREGAQDAQGKWGVELVHGSPSKGLGT